MPTIHPTSVVENSAIIADDVSIGPQCYVGAHVTLGAGCRLIGHCYIDGHTTMGKNNVVYPSAVLGMEPQDYEFDPKTLSYLTIGDNNIFREGVTVHRGTKPESTTIIGNGCFLMGNTHVAHNCVLGDKVVLVQSTGISGYVTLDDSCFISGICGIHQFCHVGRLALMSGGSFISKDLPPFMIADGRNGAVRGANVIGMRRHNFSREAITAIRKVYSIVYRSGLPTVDALEKIATDVPVLPEVNEFVDFVNSSTRGILKSDTGGRRD
jgi:UDP-N-acetylglucosamine acyltransferase